MSKAKPTTKKKQVRTTTAAEVIPLTIAKPNPTSVFERFKSKKPPTIGGLGTHQPALPLLKISDAGDFVRLSTNPHHWSPELCFVTVPIHGEKQDLLHFIDEEIATRYLPAKRIKRFRLALASKPHDAFFLAIIPTTNLDNRWNESMLSACEKAKTNWAIVSSRKAEGVEGYKVDFAEDPEAFPEPDWARQNLETLVEVSFHGRMIDRDDHPALARLLGRKVDLK